MGSGDDARDYAPAYLAALDRLPAEVRRLEARAHIVATVLGLLYVGGAVAFGWLCWPQLTAVLGIGIGTVWFGGWLAAVYYARRTARKSEQGGQEMRAARLADRIREGELAGDPWQAHVSPVVRWAWRRQAPEDYRGHLVRCSGNLAWFYQPPARHFPLQAILWIVAVCFNLLGGFLAYAYLNTLDYSSEGFDFNLIMVAVLALGTGFLLPTFALNDAINLEYLGKYLDAELRREVLSGEQRRAEEVASGAVLQLNEVESRLEASYVHSGAGLPAVLVLVVLLVQPMAWDRCLGLDLRAFAENVPDAAVAGGATALLICLFIIEFWLGRRWRARYARQIRRRLVENRLGEKLLRGEISHTQLEQRLPAPLRYLGFLPRLPSKLANELQRTAWRMSQRLDWYLDPARSPAARGWASCLTYLAGAVLLVASAAVILLRTDAAMPSLPAYLFVTAASVLGALALAQIRVYRMQARVWREELFRHLREVLSK